MKRRTIFNMVIFIVSFVLIVLAICNIFLNVTQKKGVRTEQDMTLLLAAIIIAAVFLVITTALLIALIIRYRQNFVKNEEKDPPEEH